MMNADHALRRLAVIAPAMQEALAHLAADWSAAEIPTVVAFGALGSALRGHLNEMSSERLSGIAEFVEEILVSDDAALKDAVATGFLEAFVSADGPEPSRLVLVLGPVAQGYLRAWDTFAGARTPGL